MPTTNSTIQFKHGLQETFSNITKDSNTIYFITDTNRLFVGDSEYTRPVQHGSELPTSKNPANSLFVKETGTARELYYSKDGTAWDMIAYLPATITGGVFGNNTAGTVAYGGTVKVPKVTVDNRGYVTAAEDVTITLPTSDKVTTVTTSGDGNAVTGGSISNDGATLTLTKGESFVPASGGTFSGDVTVSGDLTAESIKTDGTINVSSSNIIDDGSEWLNRTTINFIDNNDGVNDSPYLQITADYAVEKGDSSNTRSIFNFIASAVNVNGHASVDGATYFYGPITQYYSQGQSSNSLTQKSYVDDAIASAISASDAMVFKGTVGTSGTAASFSAINVSSATKGDTYKVITADTLPAASSFDSTAHDLTPGDLIVYMGKSKFIYVPSGDEDVTSVKVAGSGDTINVSTTAQTGTVVLGDVATKKVSTSTTLNGNGASNDNVATELAVKTYVDDTVGALENTLGTAATTNATDYATAAQGTKADNAMPKSGGTFTGDVTVSGDLTADNIKTSGEITITPNTNVDITTDEQEHDNSKITFVNTNKVNDATPISIESVYKAAVYGSHAYDTSILKLNAGIVRLGNSSVLETNYINNLEILDTTTYNEGCLSASIGVQEIDDVKIEMGGSAFTGGNYIYLKAPQVKFNGAVTLAQAPTDNMHAATKKYVDDAVTAATLTWKTL